MNCKRRHIPKEMRFPRPIIFAILRSNFRVFVHHSEDKAPKESVVGCDLKKKRSKTNIATQKRLVSNQKSPFPGGYFQGANLSV